MKSIINKLFKRKHGYGAIVREVLPVFHCRFELTNKFHKVFDKDDPLVNSLTMETQNGVNVEFDMDFENNDKFIADSEFVVNEVKSGMIYETSNSGFMENIQSIHEVVLVTDRFVYSKNINFGGISILSHNEVEKMKKMNGFIVKETTGGLA